MNTEPIKRYGEAENRFQKRYDTWKTEEDSYKQQQQEMNAESKRREPQELQDAIDAQTIRKIARSPLYAEIERISSNTFSVSLKWIDRRFGCPTGDSGCMETSRCYFDCDQTESEMELLPDDYNRTNRYLRHASIEEISVGSKGTLLYCFNNALGSIDLKNYIFLLDKKEVIPEEKKEEQQTDKE